MALRLAESLAGAVSRFTHTDDVARGDWIRRRLTGAWGSVTGVVPTGFDHYLRVFHPTAIERRPATWRDWCMSRGRQHHPLMQWNALDPECHDQRDHRHPSEGALDPASWSVLAAALGSASDAVTVGLWSGYGHIATPGRTPRSITVSAWSDTGDPVDVDALVAARLAEPGWVTDFATDVRRRPQLVLPRREYVLFTGELGVLIDPTWREQSGWAYHWGETLNLAWPDDQTWCVATEIDFNSTLMGCDGPTADRVRGSGLEVAEVGPGDSLRFDADLLNGSPS